MSHTGVPDWVKDAVFYQIFPDRFENGDRSNDPPLAEQWGKAPRPNNFFGGDLQGIMDRTPYLKELGINAVYLNPIFEATSNHKYNTKDYTKIDPAFGTNELFDRYIAKCKEAGIRTVIDGVFNHVGTAHSAFEDVVKNGAKSAFAPWFNIYSYPVQPPKTPNYECWWGYGSLPKLMVQHPEVRQHIYDVVKLWTSKIDGWRLDVANEIPHQFWKGFREKVRSENPECYIVGELWEDASPWMKGDEFDATMNYRFRDACLKYFANDAISAEEFDKHLETTRKLYSEENNLAMQNLLGSHDTERYLTLCKGDIWKVKLSAIFQMTYIGAPMIYYGDEIGMEGGKDPDCRRCMEWDPKKWNTSLRDLYKNLIAIRHSSPALRRGSFATLLTDNSKDIIAFERKSDSHAAFVVINKKERSAKIDLPVSVPVRELKDELSGEIVSVTKGTAALTVPARSARIFIVIGEGK